jgi:hypothetical protein
LQLHALFHLFHFIVSSFNIDPAAITIHGNASFISDSIYMNLLDYTLPNPAANLARRKRSRATCAAAQMNKGRCTYCFIYKATTYMDTTGIRFYRLH